jgi:hypothetical protein
MCPASHEPTVGFGRTMVLQLRHEQTLPASSNEGDSFLGVM